MRVVRPSARGPQRPATALVSTRLCRWTWPRYQVSRQASQQTPPAAVTLGADAWQDSVRLPANLSPRDSRPSSVPGRTP
jgi:hypothetical protein